MKNHLRSVFILCLSLLLVFTQAVPSFAADKDPAEDIELIFKNRMESAGVSSLQELVWYFADNAGQGEEWWIISLRQYMPGQLDFSEYRKAYREYAENSNLASATSRLKCALTLQALGSDSSYIDRTVDDATGQLGIMSYIYGLHLLNNGANSTKFTKQSVTASILDLQLADGGWAVMGDGGDVDVTGMAVQALAPSCASDSNVKQAVERAIELLSERQKDDATFLSFGKANPESTAQVVLALSEAGIDCTKDERFIKNGTDILDVLESFKVSDGAYAHNRGEGANASASIQVLYSYVGYEMMLQGRGSYHIFGDYSEPSVQRPEGISYKTENEGSRSGAEGTDTQKTESPSEQKSVRPLLYAITAGAVVIAIIILIILRKKSYKSYLFVMILGAAAALGITFINIEKPSDYYGSSTQINDPVRTYITIRCDTVAGEKDHIPEDGIILDNYEITIEKGQSAYDQLIAAVRQNSIQIDVSAGSYVYGIANIYELDFGDLSGWMFRINGVFSDTNCNEKVLSEGDLVEWLYTRNIGKDIGNEYMGD